MRIVRTRLAHDFHRLNAQCYSTISADAMTECLVFNQTVAAIDAYYHKMHTSRFGLQSDN